MIDYVKLDFYGKVISWVSNAALWIYVLISNRHRATKKNIDDHDVRLTCLESDIKHMPTVSDIIGLNARIDKINGILQRVDGRLEGLNRAVDLMNEFLINRGGK